MNVSTPSVAPRQPPVVRALALGLCCALLTACAAAPARPVAAKAKAVPAQGKPMARTPAAGAGAGPAADGGAAGASAALGWSSGPSAAALPLGTSADLPPDPEPVAETPLQGGPNRPYRALGRQYTPTTEDEPHVERGLASWYGKRFHGRRTASGERFDMNAMTAAHPTWPLPSYARVRNVATGREVIVRINDRGPFHPGRIIDLSYTAARKLGVDHGPSTVEVERLTAESIRTGAWRRDATPAPGDRPPLTVASAERSLSTAPPAAGAALAADAPMAESAWTVAATATATPVATASLAAPPAAVAWPGPPASAGLPDAVTPTSVESAAASALLPLSAATTTAATTTTASQSYWVQLGAFSRRDGADAFHRQVAATSDMGWIAPWLTVATDSELHRLQAGPFASRDEAQTVAQRVRGALSLVPVIVERR